MADIIIRVAKKDFVCSKCGHIIRSGTEYLDKIITHDGRAVRHERYHDECPRNKVVTLFAKIAEANFHLPVVDPDGCKWKAVYITKDRVHVESWDGLETGTVGMDRFLNEWRYNN